jgi:hypothetical protein
VIDLNAVQSLIAGWWFEYDQGNFDVWSDYWTADAHFSCRSDSGQTDFEEFVRADCTGRDTIVAWNTEHRKASPYPLRHIGTNVHITATRNGEADFRSYLFTSHVVDGLASNLTTGIVAGTVRQEGDVVRFSELGIVLDMTASVAFAEASRFPLVV